MKNLSHTSFNRKTLVPEYLRELKTYQAGKPIDEVVREKGLTRISKLASNENPHGASPRVVKAIQEDLQDIHRYPDMYAYGLKQKLCEIYRVKPENIILGNGSEGVMAYIVRAFLGVNDVVLTSENTFIGFYILAQSVGACVEKYALTHDYVYDLKTLATHISEKTKIIYLANPNNPTGTYFNKQSFDDFMKYVPEHVLVIMDEAYFEFANHEGFQNENLKNTFPNSMDYRYDNVITLRTFSKAYGISGLRVGYGLAHEDLIHMLTKVKLTFEPNSLGQVAGLAALCDSDHLTMSLDSNKKLRAKTFDYLKNKNFNPIPSVTNFITFKTGSMEASSWMFEKLLDLGVIIRPLVANDMPEYVRVSIGTENEMAHYFQAMDEILPIYNNLFGRPS